MKSEGLITIILAAGKGTRMKSKLPKVLHCAGGKPMVEHVLDAAKSAGSTRNIVVVGFGREQVQAVLGDKAEIVLQEEQLGTGHAVMQAESLIKDKNTAIMVLCGDTPLVTGATLKNFYEEHVQSGAKASVLTTFMSDPFGYGRVIRLVDGSVEKIVEQKDASERELAINEINTGIYCFDAEALFNSLKKVNNNNAQGEYYLPDVLSILRGEKQKINASIADNYEETLGINSREQLANAEKIIRQRKNKELMAQGVTLMDPNSTYVDVDVEIGQDTMQKYIDKFDYGNKDISDWDGKTDLDDDPRDLKGFCLETSLKISPLEQVQLLNRLFSANENPMALAKLKELMLVYEDNNTGLKIYGKTGFGKVNGENTDAWFTGFYEINNQRTYYSVRLDDTKNPQALSSTAKEIAINIIKNQNK